MLWFCLGALVVLLTYAWSRAKKMGPLFTDEHLAEVAALLPELKRKAIAGQEGEPASSQTSALALAYTIDREGEASWVHHLSVSSPLTPARAAGTFFLGLGRARLGLGAYRSEAFVSQNHVFHLVVRLSDEEQEAFAALPMEPMAPDELRGLAIAGRAVLLPQLQDRAVPLPAPNRAAAGVSNPK